MCYCPLPREPERTLVVKYEGAQPIGKSRYPFGLKNNPAEMQIQVFLASHITGRKERFSGRNAPGVPDSGTQGTVCLCFGEQASDCNLCNKKRIKHRRKYLILLCAPLGARTLDTLIKSQVLYQLS